MSAVTDDGRTLDAALDATPAFAALEGRDRAFARAIASTTLRRLGGLDAVLSSFLSRPLEAGAEQARAILRTGAAQLLAMGAPAHAVVSEAVRLADASRKARPFKGLINAVLRRVDSEGRATFDALPPGADLPAWLFARWRAAYGDETAAAIAEACRAPTPPIDLTVRSDAPGWAARLDGAVGPFGAVRLAGGGPVSALPGFDDGAWWVQDAAAALPARLLGDVSGKRVLDMCAAPGGKTLQLAAAGADVTALDVDPERLERVRENLTRTGLRARLVAADARAWTPEAPFDAILLDAPCTATGTLRRHPDAAWLRRPTDIAALSGLQRTLLTRAAAWLKPGGRLVYAVCSLEPEEGPGAVAAAPPNLTPEPVDPALGLPAALVTPTGAVRTLPCHFIDLGGVDGFFAQAFRRAG